MQIGIKDQLPIHGSVLFDPSFVAGIEHGTMASPVINREVERVLQEANQRATRLLMKNRTDLDLLAEAILAAEKLTAFALGTILSDDHPASSAKTHG